LQLASETEPPALLHGDVIDAAEAAGAGPGEPSVTLAWQMEGR
jgi:hypothetical protein